MKDFWKSGVLILLIIGVLYIIFLRECKKETCPPQGQVLLSQAAWDSIQAIANKPPEIKVDTFWKEGPTIYIPGKPIPVPVKDPKDTTINHYSDSLNRKDINVWYDFKVRGTLLDRTWKYNPTFLYTVETKTIYVPKIIKDPIPIYKSNVFVYGQLGGNLNTFIPGAGVDYTTKKGTEFGYLYQRWGKENIHSFKLGTRINLFR